MVDGVLTEIATAVGVGPAWGGTETDFPILVDVSGTGATVTITVTIDGVQEISYDDTAAARHTTGDYGGRYMERGWSNADGQPFTRDFEIIYTGGGGGFTGSYVDWHNGTSFVRIKTYDHNGTVFKRSSDYYYNGTVWKRWEV